MAFENDVFPKEVKSSRGSVNFENLKMKL